MYQKAGNNTEKVKEALQLIADQAESKTLDELNLLLTETTQSDLQEALKIFAKSMVKLILSVKRNTICLQEIGGVAKNRIVQMKVYENVG